MHVWIIRVHFFGRIQIPKQVLRFFTRIQVKYDHIKLRAFREAVSLIKFRCHLSWMESKALLMCVDNNPTYLLLSTACFHSSVNLSSVISQLCHLRYADMHGVSSAS